MATGDKRDRRLRIDAIACPQCSGPLEPGKDRCPWCGSAVVLDSRAAPLDMAAIRREYAHLGLEELRERADRRPIDPAARYALGMAYADLGLLDDAADALRSACERMPEHAPFQAALARVYDRQDQAGMPRRGSMADDRIERALARDPNCLDALGLASERAARKGDPVTAFAYLRRAAIVDPEEARPLAQAYVEGNRAKIRASWAYAPHRAETTRAGQTTATSAMSGGCTLFGIFGVVIVGIWIFTATNSGGSPVDGWWWGFAAIIALAGALGSWLNARHNRNKAIELLQTLTPEEQAIVNGTATTMEMVDALDAWATTELDTMRRAAEAAAREKANTEALIAGAAALEGVSKSMNALTRPTRSRRRKSGLW